MVDTTYSALGSRNNFNKALRHFYTVNEFVEEVEDRKNIAEVIAQALDDKELSPEQILPVVGAIIRDKYKYSFHSFDTPVSVSDFKKITNETMKWTALDIVLVYFDPNGQIYVINPKNEYNWEKVRDLASDHLVVIYTKYLKEEGGDVKIESDAIKAIEEMLSGRDVYVNKKFIDSSIRPPAPAPKPAARKEAATPESANTRMTPKYSVQVTNELFHNGNVEAWKKIIESFKTKHPDLEVKIFYEGEIINDINTLFKWGKVKHHGLIFFQVIGDNIKDVSKLQKYLFEGASQRFEQFLHGQVGQVLNLF